MIADVNLLWLALVLSSPGVASFLHRGAAHVSVRAEDAAIARPRPQELLAASALVEVNACVFRHVLETTVPTMGTRDCGGEDHPRPCLRVSAGLVAGARLKVSDGA